MTGVPAGLANRLISTGKPVGEHVSDGVYDLQGPVDYHGQVNVYRWCLSEVN